MPHQTNFNKETPSKLYKKEYVRFRIVAMVEGKFRNYVTAEATNNLDLFIHLHKLIDQVNAIHKIRINKHQETKRIIGVEIQVKDTFNLAKYKKSSVILKNPKALEFDKDVFKPLVDSRFTSYWDEIIHSLSRGKQLLQKPSPQEEKQKSQKPRNKLSQYVKEEQRKSIKPRQTLTMHELRQTKRNKQK